MAIKRKNLRRIFISIFFLYILKKEIKAIYEDDSLRIVKPAKIEGDKITVKILNRDEILTDGDVKDVLKAINEKNKGKAHSFDDVFG